MANQGFCYLAADDDVVCAGIVGGVDHGMRFESTGQHGATQVMVMFFDNGMCITTADHTVQCMGSNENAFGATGISSTFTQWTDHTDVAAIATGTWDQLCGITLDGQVFCGGGPDTIPSYGHPPVDVGPRGQTSVWVDDTGMAHLSDASVLRAGESYATCQIEAHGLACEDASFGPTDGSVVMGTSVASTNPMFLGSACWLTGDATATCTYGPRFAQGKVLYLAAGFYTDSLCAIYSDGSVWCIGSNANGKLGTGDDSPLMVETMVAPPGSAHIGCDP